MSDINEVPAFAAQQAQTGAYLGGKATRPKTWHERSAEEKLDALRDHIEVLTHRLQDAEKLLQRLRFHQHSPS